MAISIPFLALLLLFAYRAPAPSGSGITDPDYYWHVGYGDWILEHGRLPATDFWSWTFDGHAYRLTQWLGEVAMAAANQLGGEVGTSALAALLVTLTIAASYRAALCYLDNRLAALAVAIGCNAILISLACRPHQFTHLGLALLTWITAAHFCGSRKALYWLPPLFAAWVNLHGGYAFGLVYLGLLVGCIAIDGFISKQPDRIRTLAVPLAIAAGAALLATLLNPYGWGAWGYAIEIAGLKSSSLGIVDEWAATSIKKEVGINYFIVTGAMFASMALSRRRPTTAEVLTALALCAIGWSAVRLSLMATVLMVPLVAASLRQTAFYDLAFDGDGRKHDRTVKPWIAAALVFITAGSASALARIDRVTERHVAGTLPVKEAAFMQANGLTQRVLNPPEAGGYLIRKTGARVALDTRLDLYGDKAFFAYLLASRSSAGWREYVERIDPQVVLINKPAALRVSLVESALFRPVFEGPSHTVLVRTGDRLDLPTVALENPNAALLKALE